MAARADRQVPIAESADQIERRARGLLACEPQGVRRHRRLDRRAHRRCRAKEPVRRRQALERLMGPLEVVVLHEELHAPLTVLIVRKHRARQELFPHRLPEPFDLPAGLRMVRAALDVLDPVPPELRLKLRRPSPRRVLPSLIRQDLPRRAVLGNPAGQRFEHQRAPLVVGHREAHQIPRVIVEKRRYIEPLMPAQQKREQIRLPQLVRLGSLEASLNRLRPRLHHAPRAQAFGLEHSAHCRRRGPNAEKALHHVPNPPASCLRVRCLRREYRPPHAALCARLRSLSPRNRLERPRPARSIPLHPPERRRIRHPQLTRDLPSAQPLVNHTPCQSDAHIHRPHLSSRPLKPVTWLSATGLLLLRHLSSPLLPRCPGKSENKC